MPKLKLFIDLSSPKVVWMRSNDFCSWQIVLFDDDNHYLDNLLLNFFFPAICKLRKTSDEQILEYLTYMNSYLDSCGRGMKTYP